MSSENRGLRLRNRILWLLSFCLLCIAAAPAQKFERFTFNAGGGWGINRGAINNFTNASYHGVVGGGVNFGHLFGLNAEYMYYNLPFQSNITHQPEGFPGAKANLQSATLNMIFNAPMHSRWGIYGIAGFGGYRRAVSADSRLLLNGTVCQPSYVLWNVTCVNGVVDPQQTVSSRTTTAGGYNYGGGISYRVGKRLKVYGEGRYHRTNNRDIRTQVFPITFGIRW